MALHHQRWGGIYHHNQMQLPLIPLPLYAVNNHHPSIQVHQPRRVVIKTRRTFTSTPSSILVHCYLHFFPFSPAISYFWQHFHLKEWLYVILLHPDERLVSWCLVRQRVTLSPFLPTICSLTGTQRLEVVGYCVVDPSTATFIVLGHIHVS